MIGFRGVEENERLLPTNIVMVVAAPI